MVSLLEPCLSTVCHTHLYSQRHLAAVGYTVVTHYIIPCALQSCVYVPVNWLAIQMYPCRQLGRGDWGEGTEEAPYVKKLLIYRWAPIMTRKIHISRKVGMDPLLCRHYQNNKTGPIPEALWTSQELICQLWRHQHQKMYCFSRLHTTQLAKWIHAGRLQAFLHHVFILISSRHLSWARRTRL